jgi:hypothetical protein
MNQKPIILRGKILEFLKFLYPEGADGRTVTATYYEYYRTEDIVQALLYLTDKGYLSKKELPHPCRRAEKIAIYRITPVGIDLYDGTITDPGVSVIPDEGA